MSDAGMRTAVGIDFGGTSVKLALVNERGVILGRRRFETRDAPGLDGWIQRVKQDVGDLVAKEGGGRAATGIGVGVPGFVDFERGFIHDLTNVPGWTGVPLGTLIEERLGLRARVDNDVNAMALGECTFGAGRTYQHAVFVTLGTGVGGGLLINNKLYRGAHSMAGEIGHISIDMNGIQSPTGFGGVEQYVGNRRIVERMEKEIDSGRPTILLDLVNGDRSQLSPKVLKAGADKGDAVALELLDFVTDCLATSFASITYTLQPQAFIVGGGVAQEANLLFQLLRKNLDKRLSPHFARQVEIKPAELGGDAGVIGCATLALIE
ncbi:MAG TPA: ROK family protein [Kiritimatiellia bacterium]|nr:ROK family protein [Kiritimatiellia bacterium]